MLVRLHTLDVSNPLAPTLVATTLARAPTARVAESDRPAAVDRALRPRDWRLEFLWQPIFRFEWQCTFSTVAVLQARALRDCLEEDL